MTRTPMTRRQRRGAFLLSAAVAAIVALGVAVTALGDRVLYFYTPSEAKRALPAPGKVVNLGGLVEAGSVKHAEKATIGFAITDSKERVLVRFTGILPDLFREGQGVVATGSFQGDGLFVASRVLAKHDERYMPPELSDKLKRDGVWRPSS